MPKLRVYQLAKELQVQSALIIELLDRMGRDIRSDLSVLDADTAELVRRRITAAINAAKKRLAEEKRIAEEQAAAFIAANVTKPVVAYIAGFTAPPGKKMGHAGAIISGSSGTAAAKQEDLEAVGVTVVTYPTEIGEAVAGLL